MARNEYFSKVLSESPEKKEEYDRGSFEQQKEMQNEFFDKILDPNKDYYLLVDEYQSVLAEANRQEIEAYNAAMGKITESVKQAVDEIKETDTSALDSLVEEGSKALDATVDSITGLAKMLTDSDVFASLKNAFTGLGTLKFADGELNLFEGAGDVLGGLLKDARNSYQDEAQQINSERGNMSTQVNNTNVIGGQSGSSPVYFPNATAIDGHSSLSRFLQSSGAIR
jgi:hypothetical protein